MDFQNANAVLDTLMSQSYQLLRENPDAVFTPFAMANADAAKSAEMTIEALGSSALAETHGVLAGYEHNGVIALLTGNSPSSPDRAYFLASLLKNWPDFYGWMKAYLNQRETGYTIAYYAGDGSDGGPGYKGGYTAAGPSHNPDNNDPFGIGDTPEAALADLLRKKANQFLLAFTDLDPGFVMGTEFYIVMHGQQNRSVEVTGGAAPPPLPHLIRIVGRWVKPDSQGRRAVRHYIDVPRETPHDGDLMRQTKLEILRILWENKERL